MRNRAKCKLCQSVIESKFPGDYVHCECGEIGIDGGENHYSVTAKNYFNFLRVDDGGNEIEVTVKEKEEAGQTGKPTRAELVDNLRIMIERIEVMPPQGMLTSINHYDFCSLLILLHSILLEDSDQNQNKAG